MLNNISHQPALKWIRLSGLVFCKIENSDIYLNLKGRYSLVWICEGVLFVLRRNSYNGEGGRHFWAFTGVTASSVANPAY